jgi:serine protease Do
VPGSGSGIIVGQNEEELLVVTNNHVVENSNTLSVVFIDSVSVNAAIKGTDADFDLAVVAVPLKDIPAETLSKITVAKMGSSDDLKVGQGVIAIGNALGYGQSVTVGWVSALDREVTTEGSTTRNLLQTDAAINPGNSGGALLNMKGEVIGINAAKYSSTDVEGIGYAIPISKAEDIINSLMTKRRSGAPVEEGQEGYLGIQGLTVDDNMARQLGMPSGIFVSGIIEDGAASRTELREKDIITKFDDQTVRSMAALQELLKYYKAGETVNMTVQTVENGQYVERTIEITLGSRETLNGGTPVRQ